jgi:hypothetical protein
MSIEFWAILLISQSSQLITKNQYVFGSNTGRVVFVLDLEKITFFHI